MTGIKCRPLFEGYFPGNGPRFKLKRMGLLEEGQRLRSLAPRAGRGDERSAYPSIAFNRCNRSCMTFFRS